MNDKSEDKFKNSFEVLDTIGKGAFGQVFSVRDKKYEHCYAIKRMTFEVENENNNKIIEREINLLKENEFNCDFVVKYICCWTQSIDNCVYIQMQLCDDNLRNILDLKPKAFNRYPTQAFNPLEYYITSEIFKEILGCVQYLHELKPPLIHRDLKPENILISLNHSNQRFLKVCDFGLAIIHDKTMTHTSKVGSVKYIAPEVFNSGHYDCRADVYSVGRIGLEIFDIDDIQSIESKIPRIQPNLRDIYRNLSDRLLSMVTGPSYSDRPTCAQVLISAEEWSIDTNVLKQWRDLDTKVKKLKEFENSFFAQFFATKFNNN